MPHPVRHGASFPSQHPFKLDGFQKLTLETPDSRRWYRTVRNVCKGHGKNVRRPPLFNPSLPGFRRSSSPPVEFACDCLLASMRKAAEIRQDFSSSTLRCGSSRHHSIDPSPSWRGMFRKLRVVRPARTPPPSFCGKPAVESPFPGSFRCPASGYRLCQTYLMATPDNSTSLCTRNPPGHLPGGKRDCRGWNSPSFNAPASRCCCARKIIRGFAPCIGRPANRFCENPLSSGR